MKPRHCEPTGAFLKVNWALQLLREKHNTVGDTEIWGDGTMRTAVNNVAMTNREVMKRAAQYPEWQERERLFLDYLNDYQRSLMNTPHEKRA